MRVLISLVMFSVMYGVLYLLLPAGYEYIWKIWLFSTSMVIVSSFIDELLAREHERRMIFDAICGILPPVGKKIVTVCFDVEIVNGVILDIEKKEYYYPEEEISVFGQKEYGVNVKLD